jgi:hypothetical protein
MRKIKVSKIILVSISILAIFIAGCFGGTKKQVKMTDLNQNLAKYEKHPTIDVLEKNKVEYDEVAKPNYDSFFKKSAKLYATVLVAKSLCTAAKDTLKNLSTSFQLPVLDDPSAMAASLTEKKGNFAPEQALNLKEQKEVLEALKISLEEVVRDGQAVAAEGKGLVNTAAKDFIGPDAMKVPAVTSGLNTSIDNIMKAIDEAPAMVSEVISLLGAITQLI